MEVSYKATGEMVQVNNVMVDYVARGLVNFLDYERITCFIGYSECNGTIEPTFIFTDNTIQNGTFIPCKMIEL